MLRPTSPRAWSVLATGAALAAVTQLLVGQQPGGGAGATGTLTGIVYDSSAAAPLGGATVLLTHATRGDVASLTIAADSAGRFAAHDLAPGRWMVAFLHRATEEYGVAPIPREVTIAGGDSGDVALSLPEARTLRTAVCGDVVSDSSGVLVGSVRDEDRGEWVAGATVTVEWRVMTITGGVKMTSRQVPVVTSADGTFRVCGLPTEDALTIRAVRVLPASTTEALSSGETWVTLPTAGIARVHVGVGRLPMATVNALGAPAPATPGVPRIPPRVAGRSRLEGTVIDPNGRPLPGARVLVLGTGQGALTNENGTFRFDSLPSGSWTVEARALGYTPLRNTVLLGGSAPASTRLAFAKWVPALDRVVVFGKMSARDRFLTDFLERKARGLGTFLTEDDVERYKPNQLSELLARVPNVRLSPSRRPGDPPTVTGRNGCPADLYVNGVRQAEGAREVDWLMRPGDVLAIEVHDPVNGTPAAFGSSTACLVIGLWSKR